ncbi:protein TIME FOR COFFEE-like isoform X2 [Amaranthus tricolor]|uniref:protein TIME FOR COFFEE-like isoform X2 n=1 Tax=Amaranthus tricolor TaxID=29722 RepID=UPI00258B1412|nr:protein TIME FOR COFFEE-like isoform X2 [Amaranthus tricolor]
MMDRNREARRAAAMVNGLPKRRHRTVTGGSLRESTDDDSPMELQETATRLRDRSGKKDRDREIRDRDRERERDRLGTKRRRGDKYSRNKEDGGADDESSEESMNDVEDEDDDSRLRYIPPTNPIPMSSPAATSTLVSHRKSYPPSKLFRVTVPKKARSVSTKRGHDCWSSVPGWEQIHRKASFSPVRSVAAGTTTVPLPSQGPTMSPSSSNIENKKKIANGPPKQRPPKIASKSSSPTTQDEIEIAEVLYGLKRQSHAPSKQDGMMPNDSANLDSRSVVDSKSRISSPVPNSSSVSGLANNSSSSTPPLTTIVPKRKRPRPYPEEIPGGLGPQSSPVSSTAKAELNEAPNLEVASLNTEKNLGSTIENGVNLVNSQEHTAEIIPSAVGNTSVTQSNTKPNLVEESEEIRYGVVRAQVEETSLTPKLESAQNHDRVESSTTSTKPNSSPVEQENHKEDIFEIDLMAPPPQSRTSPEREEVMAENGGADEKAMVTDSETEAKHKNEDNNKVNGGDDNKDGKEKETRIDLHLDLTKSNVNDDQLNIQKQLPKMNRDDDTINTTKHGGQSGSAPLLPVPGGWHGGLATPMGYVGPLQGVVSMDGAPTASPPIQPPPFLLTKPKPKRSTTHLYIAKCILAHQQLIKVTPFWPAAAAAPVFGAKSYNLNMMPSADLHGANARGVVDNKGQPFTFFPGQSAASSKDTSQPSTSAPDSSMKKQFLVHPALPLGTPNTILHSPMFFPMNQQQAPVPGGNVRPSTTKSPSPVGSAPSNSVSTSGPMGTPTMSFSYPNMGGNETPYMTILGNGAYPFPMPAHVGTAPLFRGSQPVFEGPFYPSQMLHPSQIQQQQGAQSSQSLTMQQQNQQNASHSTSSSSSQRHLQSQQMRPHGSSVPSAGNMNQGLQNFQITTKAQNSQLHNDMGGEDRPSTDDSRTLQNMSAYGQNFAVPFHSPNFALITPPTSMGAPGNNAAGVLNGNLGDKMQQQPQQTPTFPMSFASPNGATPGFDISSKAYNPAILQSIPETALQNYKKMAAAAAVASAAQAAQQKNSYRGPEDGKEGSAAATDSSNMNEERKTMAARASAATVGQSIAFSRDVADNSVSSMVGGNNVVDSSARSLNVTQGSSARPSRSSVPTSISNSNASNSQQQQQMLFPKQQPYVALSGPVGPSKTPTTTNGNVYPWLSPPTTSNGNVYPWLSSPTTTNGNVYPWLSGFSTLVQTSGTSVQSPQLKNIVRPNSSQVSSPSPSTSIASNTKNLPQQQGRSQQNHTQISFGAAAANPKPSSMSQGQQAQNNNQAPPSPMLVGSPSTSSVSKGASGSPRNTPSGNKVGAQGSTLPSQSGRNSQSPSISTQKPSFIGGLHVMPNSTSCGKSQSQQSQQQAVSMQNIQQTQIYFNNAYMQPSASTSATMAGGGYHLQMHRHDGQKHQQGSKSQTSVPITSSSGMIALCAPVSQANTSTSDPAKGVSTSTAAAGANNMKGGLPPQGIFHAAQFAAGQSAGVAPLLLPAGFPYAHAVSTTVQPKSAEQKQPAGD